MPDAPVLSMLALGFLLGVRHALDADHIAAVSTLLTEQPTWRRSGAVGFWWGLGHTATLMAVGLAVILFKVSIPERVAEALEFGVGVMLVLLGGSLAVTLVRERWHVHLHRHDGESHLHLHSHRLHEDHRHGHWLRPSLRPLLVGMVHGLAGSAALMLLVLAAGRSAWEGMAYILVFGIGSIAGMVCVGMLLCLPLSVSASFGRRAGLAIRGLASLGSIGLGLAMIVRIAQGAGPF
jgi:high-affinity nickel permease